MIDPRSELADVLDAILRDLGQVVRYDQVRILLLPSVLDMQGSGAEEDENTLLITVRESGRVGDVARHIRSVSAGALSAQSFADDVAKTDRDCRHPRP